MSLKTPKVMMALRSVLTLGCLAVLVHWWRDRPPLELAQWQWKWGWLAMTLSPVIIVVRAIKWRACLGGLPIIPSRRECLRSYLGALPLAAVTPGRAGELARPLYFKSPTLRHLETSGRLLLDNWTDTLAVLLCTLPGCFWLFGPWGLLIGFVGFSLLTWVPIWLKMGHWLISFLGQSGWSGRLREILLKLLPPAEVATSRLLFEGLAWGVFAYTLESFQFLFLLKGMGIVEVAFIPLFSGLALIHLANSVQFTIAGIGPREGMTVWLLAKLGLSENALISSSFIQTALIFLVPAGIGLFFKLESGQKGLENPKIKAK